MRIYIAGPMRGRPQFNFPAFDKAAHYLEGLGHEVFSPAERDRTEAGFDTTNMTGHEDLAAMGFNLREALKIDTTWIALYADAVAVLPGWEQSSGARAEVALAHALGLSVASYDRFWESIGGGFDGCPFAKDLILSALPSSGSIEGSIK